MTPEQLKAWRRRLGLTQQQAAIALGYSSADAYYRLESGRRRISEQVEKLTEFLEEKQKSAHKC